MEKKIPLEDILASVNLPWGTDDFGNVIDCNGNIIASCCAEKRKGKGRDRVEILASVISECVTKYKPLEKRCCEVGTYRCQVPMPLNGRLQSIDRCIADVVAALNAASILTKASCCGHGKMDAEIALADGRKITISNLIKEAK